MDMRACDYEFVFAFSVTMRHCIAISDVVRGYQLAMRWWFALWLLPWHLWAEDGPVNALKGLHISTALKM